jgi:hypothetical protein
MSVVVSSVTFLALANATLLAQGYLTKDGHLTKPLKVVELQGGFAGHTGVRYTVAPDGSWTSERLFNEKATPEGKGKLTEKGLTNLAAVLEKYDLAHLPAQASEQAVVNPHSIILEFGAVKASLVRQGPPRLDPENPTGTVESRFAGIRKGVVGLLTPAQGKGPAIKKLGTLDLLMVETTPVVFKGRLYRFEYVRDNYPANKTGASYFRFIDVATGEAPPAFARGQHLGCAFVEDDTAYAFGVDKWGGSKVTAFKSKDLGKWEEHLALHLPGWGLYNTSVCKADGRYVMAVEVGEPKEVVGVPFTIFFAESKDLRTWKLLPLDCVYSKEKYTACPALRYLDGTFYMIYLETRPGPVYESHIVRSRDLRRWESSRLNPVLAFSDEDRAIANPKLTAEQRRAVAQAKDINNSDVDLCEFRGKTVLYYSWGNQQGTEFLAEAVYNGTLADFLRRFFP